MSAPPPSMPPPSPAPQDFDAIIRQRQAEAAQSRMSGQFRTPSIRATSPVRPPSMGQQQITRPVSTPAYNQPTYAPPPNRYGNVNNSCDQGSCGCDDQGCEMGQMMDCDNMDVEEGGHDDALAAQRTPLRIIAAITMAFAVVELGIGTLICGSYIFFNPPELFLVIFRTEPRRLIAKSFFTARFIFEFVSLFFSFSF